ncbi:MAG: hypothetical protein DCF12_14145 [Snowella sp.]|jgi:hypothetical protein|nr:MAG: hypothetical protein DCF12_14145 [Snowella sp.]
MNYRQTSLKNLIIGSTILSLLNIFPQSNPVSALPIAQPKPISEFSQISIRGIAPILVGMTVSEAMRASGQKLINQGESGGGPSCRYYKIKGVKGIAFMVTNGRIARVDVTDNSKITTLSGAKIGDSESKIKSLYPNQIKVEAHEYDPKGHYLIFVPKDSQDKNYRIIFETDGKKVTRWRSGKLPEVQFIEGCA